MSKDLLLEIGVEEVPAHAMPGILQELKTLGEKALKELRLEAKKVKTLGTPRRFALVIEDLAPRQQDVIKESRGPAVGIAFDDKGAPTKAAVGFARGQKISPEELIVKDGYVYAKVEEKGEETTKLLQKALPEIITGLSFPNSMRWGSLSFRFIRPLRWIVALYGGDIIPFSVANVASGNISRGHRVLSKGDFVIPDASLYEKTCEENFVIADQEKRREIIRREIEETAKANGGLAEIEEDLMEEVLYLVEYPTALAGSFDEKYLALPQEAVITPMRDHQRYFPVKKDGKLLPLFITVRNGGKDFIDTVKRGNERVLRARLEDAEFFFNEDRKKSLEEHKEKLKTVVFQEGLGSLYEKSERLVALAEVIGIAVGADEKTKKQGMRAASLSKADLVTGMVTEFTELQGIMGREYAKLDGEDEAVALAIDEHYMPRFAGDSLPTTDPGRIVSIADKIDTIVGTFSRGKIPTGSQDPFALRRSALGMVNTLIDAKWSISLKNLIIEDMNLYTSEGVQGKEKQRKLLAAVEDFVRLRMKNVLETKNIRYDVADAVLDNVNDPYGVLLRAEAVSKLVDSPDKDKLQAFTRVNNLAKKATSSDINTKLLTSPQEKKLLAAYEEAKDFVEGEINCNDYSAAIERLLKLAEPIDEFFDAVMVMDENMELRNSRLGLLKSISDLASEVANFEKIV